MIRALVRKLLAIAWFLPGFLLWAAFPPMGEMADALFALAPLMWLSRRAAAKASAKRWFQSGLFFWGATLAWMPAIVKNGGPWPLVVLGWGALAAYCALYFAAYGWLSAKVWAWVRGEDGMAAWRRDRTVAAPTGGYWRRLVAILVAEPVLWCGLELVRSRLGGGFAWNQLGVVPVNAGYGAPAALGGVYLCSAVVVLVNGMIASIVERMWRPDPRWPRPLRSMETILPFLAVWGLYRVSVPKPALSAETMKVAMVQRNFPCVFRAGEDREHPWLVYSNLFETVGHAGCDLVALSESALCEFGAVDSASAVEFARRARSMTGAKGVLTGGARRAAGCEYNSAALLTGAGIETYDKVHLVPFGEFIPGDKLIPALQRLAPVGSCTAGELKTLDFGGVPVGVAICFEDTDSAQIRRLVELGARLLVFITNDSWFSHSDEAVQHAWQAVARAVETGLPVVRTGNSGVSGVISPDGKATWLVDADGRPLVDSRGTMVERVALPVPLGESDSERVRTWYVRLGDRPLACAFALLVGLLVAARVRLARWRRSLGALADIGGEPEVRQGGEA